MDNYKIKVKEAESKPKAPEYLVKDVETGNYFLTTNNSSFVGAIEVPEGADCFMHWPSGQNVFYRSNQSEYWNSFYKDWHFVKGDEGIDEMVCLWSRKPTQDTALFSGADAHKALLAGENVQYSGDGGEEHWDTALNCNIGVFLNQEKFPNFKFRIAPRTIKVNSELPKPSKVTLHNQNYSVTYEFKTREERNAFADKLRGTNS